MAHLTVKVAVVLVQDYITGDGKWMVKSEARRLCEADPRYEQIDQEHPCYEAVAKSAGPMPEILIAATESYKEER
mgnify:FL=1